MRKMKVRLTKVVHYALSIGPQLILINDLISKITIYDKSGT